MLRQFDIVAYQSKGRLSSDKVALSIRMVGEGELDPPVGLYLCNRGETITITATDTSEFLFSRWVGHPDCTSNQFTVTMDTDLEITASFVNSSISYDASIDLFDPLAYQTHGLTTSEKYVLDIQPIGRGSTNYTDGAHIFLVDSVVTVTATPDNNFTFAYWLEYPEIGSNNTIQLIMDRDRTLTPVFQIIEGVTFDTIIIGEGATTGSSNGIYSIGDTITLEATPETGWEFVRWVINDATVSKSRYYQHTLSEDAIVKAIFQRHFYDLDLYIVGDGYVTYNGSLVSDTIKMYHGQSITLTAHSLDGSEFYDWAGDYTGFDSSSLELTFIAEADTKLTVNFSKRKFVIDKDVIGNGQITVSPDKEQYDYNEKITITATPDEGYTFLGWFGNLVGTEPVISRLKMVRNMSIVARFGE